MDQINSSGFFTMVAGNFAIIKHVIEILFHDFFVSGLRTTKNEDRSPKDRKPSSLTLDYSVSSPTVLLLKGTNHVFSIYHVDHT